MRLTRLLKEIPGIIPLDVPETGFATFFNFTGRISPNQFRVDRKTIIDALNAEGVPVSSYIPKPLYQYELFKNRTMMHNINVII